MGIQTVYEVIWLSQYYIYSFSLSWFNPIDTGPKLLPIFSIYTGSVACFWCYKVHSQSVYLSIYLSALVQCSSLYFLSIIHILKVNITKNLFLFWGGGLSRKDVKAVCSLLKCCLSNTEYTAATGYGK